MKVPRSRMIAPPKAAMPRLVRLIGGLVIVLIAMYMAWQKAQERPAPQPAPQPGGPVPIVVLPDQEAGDPAGDPTRGERKPDHQIGQFPKVRMEAERVVKTQIKNVKIRDQEGEIVFQGTIDLRDTLDRIERGQRGSHGNDGSVFQNRERRLPSKRSGYYHEWVHPTPKLRGPGPQRIVTGEEGEIYYTPDHYKTFERLDSAAHLGEKVQETGGRDP